MHGSHYVSIKHIYGYRTSVNNSHGFECRVIKIFICIFLLKKNTNNQKAKILNYLRILR